MIMSAQLLSGDFCSCAVIIEVSCTHACTVPAADRGSRAGRRAGGWTARSAAIGGWLQWAGPTLPVTPAGLRAMSEATSPPRALRPIRRRVSHAGDLRRTLLAPGVEAAREAPRRDDPDEHVPLHERGSAEEMAVAVAERRELMRSPAVLTAIGRFWFAAGLQPDELMDVSTYCALYARIARALGSSRADEPAAVTRALALADWRNDRALAAVRGYDDARDDGLSLAAFSAGLFELTDVWTVGYSEAEYVGFLHNLLARITRVDDVRATLADAATDLRAMRAAQPGGDSPWRMLERRLEVVERLAAASRSLAPLRSVRGPHEEADAHASAGSITSTPAPDAGVGAQGSAAAREAEHAQAEAAQEAEIAEAELGGEPAHGALVDGETAPEVETHTERERRDEEAYAPTWPPAGTEPAPAAAPIEPGAEVHADGALAVDSVSHAPAEADAPAAEAPAVAPSLFIPSREDMLALLDDAMAPAAEDDTSATPPSGARRAWAIAAHRTAHARSVVSSLQMRRRWALAARSDLRAAINRARRLLGQAPSAAIDDDDDDDEDGASRSGSTAPLGPVHSMPPVPSEDAHDAAAGTTSAERSARVAPNYDDGVAHDGSHPQGLARSDGRSVATRGKHAGAAASGGQLAAATSSGDPCRVDLVEDLGESPGANVHANPESSGDISSTFTAAQREGMGQHSAGLSNLPDHGGISHQHVSDELMDALSLVVEASADQGGAGDADVSEGIDLLTHVLAHECLAVASRHSADGVEAASLGAMAVAGEASAGGCARAEMNSSDPESGCKAPAHTRDGSQGQGSSDGARTRRDLVQRASRVADRVGLTRRIDSDRPSPSHLARGPTPSGARARRRSWHGKLPASAGSAHVRRPSLEKLPVQAHGASARRPSLPQQMPSRDAAGSRRHSLQQLPVSSAASRRHSLSEQRPTRSASSCRRPSSELSAVQRDDARGLRPQEPGNEQAQSPGGRAQQLAGECRCTASEVCDTAITNEGPCHTSSGRVEEPPRREAGNIGGVVEIERGDHASDAPHDAPHSAPGVETPAHTSSSSAVEACAWPSDAVANHAVEASPHGPAALAPPICRTRRHSMPTHLPHYSAGVHAGIASSISPTSPGAERHYYPAVLGGPPGYQGAMGMRDHEGPSRPRMRPQTATPVHVNAGGWGGPTSCGGGVHLRASLQSANAGSPTRTRRASAESAVRLGGDVRALRAHVFEPLLPQAQAPTHVPWMHCPQHPSRPATAGPFHHRALASLHAPRHAHAGAHDGIRHHVPHAAHLASAAVTQTASSSISRVLNGQSELATSAAVCASLMQRHVPPAMAGHPHEPQEHRIPQRPKSPIRTHGATPSRSPRHIAPSRTTPSPALPQVVGADPPLSSQRFPPHISPRPRAAYEPGRAG